MRKSVFLGLIAAAIISTPIAVISANAATRPGSVPRSERNRQLQKLTDMLRDAGVPGVYAEFRDGKDVWRGTSGVADATTNRKLESTFEHRIGTATETFIAATVLQLADEGRIRLDAPIGQYLPDVVPGEFGNIVTARMILNHTSGIKDYIQREYATTIEGIQHARVTTFSPREIVAASLRMTAISDIGKGYSYSSANYHIAGLLIEKVTGKTYASEVTRRILQPLRLDHTYFPGGDANIRGPHATGYYKTTDGKLVDITAHNMSYIGAGGELISTVQDLNNFYRSLWEGKVLSSASLKEMRTTVVMDPTYPDFSGYGLGIHWRTSSCGKVWGHLAMANGYLTQVFINDDGSKRISIGENRGSIMNGTFGYDQEELEPLYLGMHFLVDGAMCGERSVDNPVIKGDKSK